MDVAHARLHNQRLLSSRFATPEEVVAWMGAVQAQDYPGALWALALRMRHAAGAPDTARNARNASSVIERAFTEGRILRTHVLRPTWHFVAPADIRWLLALTAPRILAAMASYDRQLEIDAAVVRRSNKAIAAALRGGVQLTRQELRAVLQRARVGADGVQRLAHLVMHAELDAVICSGARRGKQFTYALLDERVPASRAISRDEALAELTRRYFVSHGPAQVKDFAWWSGLTIADARAGLEMASGYLADDLIGGHRYWFSSSMRNLARPPKSAYLLPLYDEFLIAYKDRSASLSPALWKGFADHDPFSAPIVLDGQVVGGWKRTVVKKTSTIALDLPFALTKADERLVNGAARRHAVWMRG